MLMIKLFFAWPELGQGARFLQALPETSNSSELLSPFDQHEAIDPKLAGSKVTANKARGHFKSKPLINVRLNQ